MLQKLLPRPSLCYLTGYDSTHHQGIWNPTTGDVFGARVVAFDETKGPLYQPGPVPQGLQEQVRKTPQVLERDRERRRRAPLRAEHSTSNHRIHHMLTRQDINQDESLARRRTRMLARVLAKTTRNAPRASERSSYLTKTHILPQGTRRTRKPTIKETHFTAFDETGNLSGFHRAFVPRRQPTRRQSHSTNHGSDFLRRRRVSYGGGAPTYPLKS